MINTPCPVATIITYNSVPRIAMVVEAGGGVGGGGSGGSDIINRSGTEWPSDRLSH